MIVNELVAWSKEIDKDIEVNIKDGEPEIIGWSSLNYYKNNTLTWIKDASHREETYNKDILLIVAPFNCYIDAKNVIYCTNPKKLFFELINKYMDPEPFLGNALGNNTYVGDAVRIGNNVVIGNNCTINGDIEIEDNVVIGDNVVINNKVLIKKNSTIQAGCVIGVDGFGYFEENNKVKKMIRHHGGVVIDEDVFVGAHTNIARGVIDDTIIHKGVKIAPSTHIGHNVNIEENAVVICSNIYGSVRVGDNAYITASTLRNQISIGENVMVGMGSVVTRDIPANQVVIGAPAKPIIKK